MTTTVPALALTLVEPLLPNDESFDEAPVPSPQAASLELEPRDWDAPDDAPSGSSSAELHSLHHPPTPSPFAAPPPHVSVQLPSPHPFAGHHPPRGHLKPPCVLTVVVVSLASAGFAWTLRCDDGLACPGAPAGWDVANALLAVFVSAALVSLWLAVLSDPGFLPPALDSGPEWAALASGRTTFAALGWTVDLKTGRTARAADGARFCDTCRVWRPVGAAHCHVCNFCCVGHDHHCGVIGACVGVRNHAFFAIFIATASSAGTLLTIATIVRLAALYWPFASNSWPLWTHFVLLFFFGWVSLLLCFGAFHCWLLASHRTTRDFIDAARRRRQAAAAVAAATSAAAAAAAADEAAAAGAAPTPAGATPRPRDPSGATCCRSCQVQPHQRVPLGPIGYSPSGADGPIAAIANFRWRTALEHEWARAVAAHASGGGGHEGGNGNGSSHGNGHGSGNGNGNGNGVLRHSSVSAVAADVPQPRADAAVNCVGGGGGDAV